MNSVSSLHMYSRSGAKAKQSTAHLYFSSSAAHLIGKSRHQLIAGAESNSADQPQHYYGGQQVPAVSLKPSGRAHARISMVPQPDLPGGAEQCRVGPCSLHMHGGQADAKLPALLQDCICPKADNSMTTRWEAASQGMHTWRCEQGRGTVRM